MRLPAGIIALCVMGYDLDDSSHKAFWDTPKWAGIVNLTVKGTFKSGHSFGHLAGYRYE
jgi:hypothetical protein